MIGKHYTIYASIYSTTCVSGAQHSLQVAHMLPVLHEGGCQCMATVDQKHSLMCCVSLADSMEVVLGQM